jgi:hypothetical protein
MASIFDAYAQAYDKSLRTENAMAENLRRAYLDRQTMDINQANAARQAQQFNIQMPVMQANAANAVSQAKLYAQLFNTPGYGDSFVGQKLAAAQAQNLRDQADREAWNRLTPAQRADALSTGLFKNLVGTEDERLQYAIQNGDLETVKQRFPGAVKGKYGIELDGIPVTPSSIGTFKIAEAKRLQDELLRGTGTSGTTPMASMAGQNKTPDTSVAPIIPLPSTKPVPPLMPTTAVTANPAFPAVGGQTAAPIQNLGGGLTYDPNARARLIQPLTNFWNGVTGGLSTGMDFLGGAASAVSPAPAVSPDFYDWLEQRPKFQYGIQPNLNFPNAPNKWLNQGR